MRISDWSSDVCSSDLIGTLDSFTAAGFALTNAQALTVSGPVNGGASTSLTTTVGNLSINGAVSGTATTLKSAGAISEGTNGSVTAATLSEIGRASCRERVCQYV